MNNIAEFYKLMNEKEIISFDIFDTLIKRDCLHPHDVFELTEELYLSKHFGISSFGFKQIRINAELESYHKNLWPTLDYIYEKIQLPIEQKNELKQCEVDIEMQLVCANKDVFPFYNAAIESGKKVIAISDMYLPAEVLKAMLTKVRIKIDEIYVSNEMGSNKSTGGLFTLVSNKLGVSVSEILHIGDNLKADVKGARKVGISSFYYIENNEKLKYLNKLRNNHLDDSCLKATIQNHIRFMEDPRKKLGFEIMGPIVFGYCQKIHDIMHKEKYNYLLFCARDMYLTYHNYIKLFPEDKEKCKYIYISLKSLELPFSACDNKNEDRKAYEQLHNIREYFHQEGFSGKVAIVDSGFGGHTQAMLMRIFKDKLDIYGIYMRISNEFCKNVDVDRAISYLYPTSIDKTYAKISGAFYECLISATHGRTLSYQYNDDGKIFPELGEPIENTERINAFQEGIQKFIDLWYFKGGLNRNLNVDAMGKAFFKLAFYPYKSDVALISEIESGNESYKKIVVDRSKNLLSDIEFTYWKGGYFTKHVKAPRLICTLYMLLDLILQRKRGF